MENKPATTIRILNADILDITRDELLRRLDRGVLVTPNVDHLVKLQSDPEFLRIYRQAEWVVCDSKIIQIMSRMLRRPFPEAIPGSSFFTAFYRYHKDDPDCRIFLLGAAEGVALKAMDNINRAMGRDIVVGAHSPSFGFEKNDEECRGITEIINRSGATVVLVGVGAPNRKMDRPLERADARSKTLDGPRSHHRLRGRHPAARSHGIPQNRHGVVLPFRQRTPAALPPIFHRRHEIFHILHPPASRVIQRSFCIILIF